MRKEVIDPNSGAILFKKDKESRDLEQALIKIGELEERIMLLEEVVQYLMKKVLE